MGPTLAATDDRIQVSGQWNLNGLLIYLITRVYPGLSSLLAQETILPLAMEEGKHPCPLPGFFPKVKLLLKIEERTALLLPTHHDGARH